MLIGSAATRLSWRNCACNEKLDLIVNTLPTCWVGNQKYNHIIFCCRSILNQPLKRVVHNYYPRRLPFLLVFNPFHDAIGLCNFRDFRFVRKASKSPSTWRIRASHCCSLGLSALRCADGEYLRQSYRLSCSWVSITRATRLEPCC